MARVFVTGSADGLGRLAAQTLLGDGHEHGIERLSYAYQERESGIADALGLAERFAGGDRVLVMLADNIFGQSIRPAIDNFEQQERGARIVLSRVEEDEHTEDHPADVAPAARHRGSRSRRRAAPIPPGSGRTGTRSAP